MVVWGVYPSPCARVVGGSVADDVDNFHSITGPPNHMYMRLFGVREQGKPSATSGNTRASTQISLHVIFHFTRGEARFGWHQEKRKNHYIAYK